MLSLMQRNIAVIHRRLIVLAPPDREVPGVFQMVTADPSRHGKLMREMQTLRGQVYLADGAIQQHQLTSDGRHVTKDDDRSWHILMLNDDLEVSGCIWYFEHDSPKSIRELRAGATPLASSEAWGEKLSTALDDDMARARRERVPYAEVGGWAVSKQSRCKVEGFLLALGAYSLSRLFGGARGVTTATSRHGSAPMLKRIGLAPVEVDGAEVPPYFDERYQCDMELLQFDSRSASPKYNGLVDLLKQRLATVAVVSHHGVAAFNAA